jgi:hypothetical protein
MDELITDAPYTWIQAKLLTYIHDASTQLSGQPCQLAQLKLHFAPPLCVMPADIRSCR